MELVNVQLGTGRAQHNKSCKFAQFKTDNIIWTNLVGNFAQLHSKPQRMHS